MRKLYILPLCILLPALQGCSHIPDPGQMPEVEPYAILRNVRCEIRDVLQEQYSTDAKLLKATIGYNLVLKGEETTKKSLGPGIKWPVLHGSISLGITAGTDSERYTQGTTILTEKLEKTSREKCDVKETTDPLLYPITGSLGLRQLIRRYVEVNRIGQTAAKDGFIQELKFRLKFNGGLQPSYELVKGLNPTTTGLFNFSSERQDTHTLTITIVPDQPEAGPKVIAVHIDNLDDEKGVDKKSGKKLKRHFHSLTPSAPGNSTAKENAEETLRSRNNQQRLEEFIQERIR